MELTASVLMFVAQILCCVLIRHKIWKYLPTLISAGMISVTVLNATMGEMDPQRLVSQTKVTLFCGFAAALYHATRIIWNRMKDRKTAQTLEK